MFDDKFVWGVASSAYQVEGTDPDDGRGKTVWDTFTEQGRIFQNQNAYTSCDHMHHYKDDYALMKNLGIKAYRFSLNWARILPEGTGRVNEKAIAMYRDMILTMKENGITPYITLFHWEFPQALQEKGGWLNEEVVDWFGEYAKVVAENFSDLCEYFITINEPQCVVGLGHLSGVHAPGLKLSVPETFQIAHNLLKAHGQAVINLRKYAKQKIRIGFAPTGGVAYPYTDSAEDIEAARKVYFGFYNPMDNWTWNISWFSDPVFLGHYPKEGLEKFKEYLPEITETDMQLIHQPLDFMGQNIYNGYYVRQGADGEPEFFSTVKPQASAAPAENTASAAPTPSSAFDGALFIGDSMTTCLKNYVTDGAGSTTALSDAEFMTRSDYSWGEAQDELNGGEGGLWLDDDTALTVTEAIDRFSATKLYIQLGKEDLTYNDVSDVTSTAQAVISALQTKYPNLEITVQAVTPMLEWIDYQGLSSGTIAQYNEAMQTYCTGKKNLKFLNIAAFCTEGYLPAEYCADPEGLCIHLNDEGCAIWADYLLGNKTPEPSPTPTPTPDPNGDSTDNTDTTDTAGDTYTDDSGDYTDNTGDYTDDTGDYTDDTGDYTEE